MVQKRVLVADRVRTPPPEGFSWVDRRFLRDHAPALSRDAILLYLFLAAVADKHGLSYWRDATVAGRLKLGEEAAIARARRELIERALVAFAPPLTQVLSLPPAVSSRPPTTTHGPEAVGDILRRYLGGRRGDR